MQFEQDGIKLTPSEADWITHQATNYVPVELARKTERARRAAIAPHLPPGIFDGIVELSCDMDHENDVGAPGLARFEACLRMQQAEEEHAIAEDGSELHTITIQATDNELEAVRVRAIIIHENAREVLMNFRKEMDEQDLSILLTGALIDEDVGPLPPNEQAEIDEIAFKDYLSDFQVTAGILAALDARYGPRPDSS